MAAVASLTVFLAAPATTANAPARAPSWAPAASASIHPGVQTRSAAGQCTANFVFFDSADVYIGQAAHCTSTDGPAATNGCQAGLLPDSRITISGADHAGRLVYNSWHTMQVFGERDANRCFVNDFALVRLDRRDHDKVNPSIPFWGGPSALAHRPDADNAKVYSYGNSSLRLGLSPLSPKEGYRESSSRSGWEHTVYTATPGVPGDSGSAFLDAHGRALGVLATIQTYPPASNGVVDLRLALDYMAHRTSLRVQLAAGTEPFSAGLLPAA